MNSAQLIQRINGPDIVRRTQTVIDTRSTAKPIRHFGISPSKWIFFLIWKLKSKQNKMQILFDIFDFLFRSDW